MKLNPTSSKLFNIFYSNIEYHTPELNTAQVKLQMYVYNLEEQSRKLKKNLKEAKLYIRKYPV